MWFGRRRLRRLIVSRHARLFGTPRLRGRPVRRLLFVCHGNMCRSPFAARLARERLDGCLVQSAGVGATPDIPSPARFVRVARTMGVDLEGGDSRRVGAAQVEWADLILAMDLDNYAQLAAEFPRAVGKMTLLGLFGREPRAVIPDPNLMSEAETQDVLELIRDAVDGLSSWLEGHVGPGPDRGPRWTVARAVEAALARGRSQNWNGVPGEAPDREDDAPCVE